MTTLITVLALLVAAVLIVVLFAMLRRSRITPFDILKAQMDEKVYQFGVRLGNALTPALKEMATGWEDFGRSLHEALKERQ
jgi:Na+/H+-dicarboxylate symporter